MRGDRREVLAILGGGLAGALFLEGAPKAGRAEDFSLDTRIAPRRWDETAGLLVGKGGGPGYATRTTSAMLVHPTRDSADYALALAEYGEPGARARIARIIDRLAELQDVNPDSATFGTWPWYAEEPLIEMRPPDLNWANFIGARLCELLWDHEALLAPETLGRARAAIANACGCIVRRNVGLDATNVVAMAIRVTAMAGVLLNRPDLAQYGARLMRRLSTYTEAQGGLAEYNSPTYTVTALLEFEAILHYLKDEDMVRTGTPLWRLAWSTAASHFHPATGQWAGPHSRAYQDLLAPLVWALIAARLGRTVPDRSLPLQPPRRAMIPCPADLTVLFSPDAPLPRTERQRFRRFEDTGEEVWGTTWLDREACLGAASIGNCWIQARPVIGYWKGAQKPVVFRARVLKDRHDFASFGIRSAQQEGRVLLAAYPVLNAGDTHISVDRAPGGFPGRELVFRLVVEGPGAQARRMADDRFELVCLGWKAVIAAGRCTFDGHDVSGRWTTSAQGDAAAVDLTIELDGHIVPAQLKETLLVAAVTLARADEAVEPPRVLVGDWRKGASVASRSLSWGDFQLVAPAVPAPR